METELEDIIKSVRACIISSKERLEIKQLVRDYRMIVGRDIPYRQFKFGTLEEFLRKIPTLSVVSRNGEIYIDAKLDEKSSHIVNMVSKQKTSKKKKPARFGTMVKQNIQQPTHWRPKGHVKSMSVPVVGSAAAQAHKQFVYAKQQPQRPQAVKKATSQQQQQNKVKQQQHQQQQQQQQQQAARNKQQQLPLRPATAAIDNASNINNNNDIKSPHSERTNRATMLKLAPMAPKPPPAAPTNETPSPSYIEELKQEALANVDITQEVWRTPPWTSSESEEEAEFVKTGDAIADLYHFAFYWRLSEPEFTTLQRHCKEFKSDVYDCKVKIGPQSFSSYPSDHFNHLSAKYYVCEHALEQLIKKYGTSKKQSILLSDEKDILERIPPLVQCHINGLWAWQVEAEYKDLYNEQLPSNWLQIIDMSEMISVETFVGKYALRYCSADDKGKSMVMPSFDVSIPTSYVNCPENATITCVITCAVSAKEVWCQHLGSTRDEYQTMLNGMEKAYNENYSNGCSWLAHNIKQGGYYALWSDYWWRARVLEVDGNDVLCFLVDSGHELIVEKNNVYILQREYAKLQAQAFLCRLEGLEELYEVSNGSEHITNLEGKTVQIESVIANDEETNKGDENDVMRVYMYYDNGKSVNDELMGLLSTENALPVLKKTTPNEVRVRFVNNEGDIYVQINSRGYATLEKLLTELEESFKERPLQLPRERISRTNCMIDGKKRLYLTRSKVDGRYYRVNINDWEPKDRYVQIYYVDWGYWEVLKVDGAQLYPLDELSTIISCYPAQAVRVRLDIDEIPKDFKTIIKQLLPGGNETVLLMVVNDDSNPKIVRMFTRKSGSFVSINAGIGDVIRANLKYKNVPSGGNLSSPPIPAIGSYYDVRIPCAVNPWNFFIQPLDSFGELKKLMDSLQERYKEGAAPNHSPLRLEDIQQGGIYASRTDGKWFRTSVIKIINETSISVFYCDFGLYGNLTLHQLVPLHPEFLRLPYQSIKAKLDGIKPKQEKWTMHDCLTFQKLVTQKNFVSVLNAVESDELYKCDKVLVIKLIDTSTNDDIFIEELLVKKKIAVKVAKEGA